MSLPWWKLDVSQLKTHLGRHGGRVYDDEEGLLDHDKKYALQAAAICPTIKKAVAHVQLNPDDWGHQKIAHGVQIGYNPKSRQFNINGDKRLMTVLVDWLMHNEVGEDCKLTSSKTAITMQVPDPTE